MNKALGMHMQMVEKEHTCEFICEYVNIFVNTCIQKYLIINDFVWKNFHGRNSMRVGRKFRASVRVRDRIRTTIHTYFIFCVKLYMKIYTKT